MPENATIVSLLNSGILVYSSVFQEIKIHNDFMERSWNLAPSAEGKLFKTVILYSTQTALAKIMKNFTLQKPMVSLCLHLTSQLRST